MPNKEMNQKKGDEKKCVIIGKNNYKTMYFYFLQGFLILLIFHIMSF